MEGYQQLLKNAFKPLDLNYEKHRFFFDIWREVEIDKGVFLTEPGKVEKSFYVVVNGVQMVYILTQEGNKKVIGFSFDGSLSGIYDSFLKLTPSHYYLEALTKSKLLQINLEQYETLFDKYPEFNYWGRIAHQELLIGRVKREIELITLSAKERFEKFMERCPEPLKQIPQKYLASYLNMSPETYSRLRADIS